MSSRMVWKDAAEKQQGNDDQEEPEGSRCDWGTAGI